MQTNLATVVQNEPVFRARRGLAGGHKQTLASFFLSRRITLPKPDSRLVEVAPGIPVLCHCYWQESRHQRMTLLIVHGLEGSADSGYVLGTAQKALSAGMNVVAMNQRNCGGTDALAPTLYNSGLSGDVAAVARSVIQRDRVSQMALVGFSMGGNLVLKAAGEWGSQGPVELKAVVAVCPSLDLAASADALHAPSNWLYETYFMWALRRRLRAKAKLFPNDFDVQRLRGVTTLRQFDDRVTSYYCGYDGAVDYYARASAANTVDRIAVPTLVIHAANDPFVMIVPETMKKMRANPMIRYLETEDGGHCAFVGERNGDGDDGRWAETRAVEFVKTIQSTPELS